MDGLRPSFRPTYAGANVGTRPISSGLWQTESFGTGLGTRGFYLKAAVCCLGAVHSS